MWNSPALSNIYSRFTSIKSKNSNWIQGFFIKKERRGNVSFFPDALSITANIISKLSKLSSPFYTNIVYHTLLLLSTFYWVELYFTLTFKSAFKFFFTFCNLYNSISFAISPISCWFIWYYIIYALSSKWW